MTVTSQFLNMTSSSNLFDVFLFLLWSLVNGPSFMSISSLVLELWQFTFIRDWPEIRKSEIPPSEFCPISGDWGKLGIPNLARMSLMKCYWMLQNARVTAFTVSELLRENQKGGKITPTPLALLTHIRVNMPFSKNCDATTFERNGILTIHLTKNWIWSFSERGDLILNRRNEFVFLLQKSTKIGKPLISTASREFKWSPKRLAPGFFLKILEQYFEVFRVIFRNMS